MKYYCSRCKSYFLDPRTLHFPSHNPYEPDETLDCCPYCGSDDYFGEVDICPCCNENKLVEDKLCTNCNTRLIAKFRKFRDFLNKAEEEALDEMLDGNSIMDI